MTRKNRKESDKDKKRDFLNQGIASPQGRTAIQRDGDKATVIHQATDKGYHVQMIRDFLDHLLLEVRVQHFENLKALRALDTTEELGSALRGQPVGPGDAIIQQFMKYQAQYNSCLVAAQAIDGTNASDTEMRAATIAVLTKNLEKRDEQIGHLEALQELFDEALACAKLPFGIGQDGQLVQPQNVFPVRQMMDSARFSSIPDYEDMVNRFSDHPFATAEGLEILKSAEVIVAQSDLDDRYLVLYGEAKVEKSREANEKQVKAMPISVSSFEELQFVLSAIRKFVGPPDTDGSPWQHYWE